MLKRTPAPQIEFHGFSTVRGDVMLDVVVGGKRQYRFGPFATKEERCRLVEELRECLRVREMRCEPPRRKH
jgi:hypothetical protein